MVTHCITVAKANHLASRPETSEARIEIRSRLPDQKDVTETEHRRIMSDDAQGIYEALVLCLPGGTLDRLTSKLLAAKVSDLRSAHQEERPCLNTGPRYSRS